MFWTTDNSQGEQKGASAQENGILVNGSGKLTSESESDEEFCDTSDQPSQVIITLPLVLRGYSNPSVYVCVFADKLVSVLKEIKLKLGHIKHHTACTVLLVFVRYIYIYIHI